MNKQNLTKPYTIAEIAGLLEKTHKEISMHGNSMSNSEFFLKTTQLMYYDLEIIFKLRLGVEETDVEALENEIKELRYQLDKAEKHCRITEEQLSKSDREPKEMTITHKIELDEKILGSFMAGKWIGSLKSDRSLNIEGSMFKQIKEWLKI